MDANRKGNFQERQGTTHPLRQVQSTDNIDEIEAVNALASLQEKEEVRRECTIADLQ